MRVEERFQLQGLGLTLAPLFLVPRNWKNRSEQVTIHTPDGEIFEAQAQFNMMHFNFSDQTVPIERRWQIVISLPTLSKSQVPIGSQLLAAPELVNTLVATAT